MKTEVVITDSPLNPEACREAVADSSCGGQVVFTGAVRDHTGDRQTSYLEYEAYTPMAEKVLLEIFHKAKEAFPVKAMVVHHRTGTLQIGEIAVVVAVSAAHRKAAFEACMFIIDELKRDVPIWKKEISPDGSEWVSSRP